MILIFYNVVIFDVESCWRFVIQYSSGIKSAIRFLTDDFQFRSVELTKVVFGRTSDSIQADISDVNTAPKQHFMIYISNMMKQKIGLVSSLYGSRGLKIKTSKFRRLRFLIFFAKFDSTTSLGTFSPFKTIQWCIGPPKYVHAEKPSRSDGCDITPKLLQNWCS